MVKSPTSRGLNLATAKTKKNYFYGNTIYGWKYMIMGSGNDFSLIVSQSVVSRLSLKAMGKRITDTLAYQSGAIPW